MARRFEHASLFEGATLADDGGGPGGDLAILFGLVCAAAAAYSATGPLESRFVAGLVGYVAARLSVYAIALEAGSRPNLTATPWTPSRRFKWKMSRRALPAEPGAAAGNGGRASPTRAPGPESPGAGNSGPPARAASLRPVPRPVRDPSRARPGSDARCPFCGGEFGAAALCWCSACDTPHHEDCWEAGEGCTTFGCGADSG